jgi:hypothetical protein
MTPAVPAGPRVLLLVPARTYRAADFLLAAARMGLDLVIGSDGALPLGGRPVIPVNPADPDRSASLITARCGPVAAVIAADAPMLELAAAVAARRGLPHNSAESVRNAADKVRQRQRWAAAGVPQPRFEIIPAAAQAGPPCLTAPPSRKPCSSPPPSCPGRPWRPPSRPPDRRHARSGSPAGQCTRSCASTTAATPGPPCSNWRHGPSAACAHARMPRQQVPPARTLSCHGIQMVYLRLYASRSTLMS